MESTHEIKFFGPSNLISRLKKTSWTTVTGTGKDRRKDSNFSAINLGGYCLTKPKDYLCSTAYSITLEKEKNNVKLFKVTGYCYPDLIMGIKKGPPVYETNTLFKNKLYKRASKKNPCKYVMRIFQ